MISVTSSKRTKYIIMVVRFIKSYYNQLSDLSLWLYQTNTDFGTMKYCYNKCLKLWEWPWNCQQVEGERILSSKIQKVYIGFNRLLVEIWMLMTAGEEVRNMVKKAYVIQDSSCIVISRMLVEM